MNNQLRTAVAYIAGRAINNSRNSSIYSYGDSGYASFSGDVTDQKVNVYDYGRSNYITGNYNGRKYSLYDYSVGAFIDLEWASGNKFKGYDYGSGSFYDGTVKGKNVEIYDYQTSQFYNYSLS